MTLALLTAMLSSGCAWLDARLRTAIYRPTPGQPASFPGLRAGDEAFFRELIPEAPTRLLDGGMSSAGSEQRVRLWWLPHPDARAPALLYLHGTFRNLYQNLPKIEALRDAGFAVLAVEYRGWGSSTPIVPSEETIRSDVTLGWHELVARVPDPARRVIYGHSMGGGAAVDLASRLRHRQDYAALVLESTFTRTPDVARSAGRVAGALGTLTTERFESIAKIGRVDAPLLMLHGTADHTVPFGLGWRLFEAANAPKRFVAIDGGSHSSLQRDAPRVYQAALQDLVGALR